MDNDVKEVNRMINMRKLLLLATLIFLVSAGCSTRNPEAPRTDETHPPLYLIRDHAREAYGFSRYRQSGPELLCVS
jgi:hypothetical protein